MADTGDLTTIDGIAAALNSGQPDTFTTAAQAFDDASKDITQAGTDATTAVQPIVSGGDGAWQGPAASAFVTVANKYAQQAQTNGSAIQPYGQALRDAGTALATGQSDIATYQQQVATALQTNGVPWTPEQQQFINGQAQAILNKVIQAYQNCGQKLAEIPAEADAGPGGGGPGGGGPGDGTDPAAGDGTDPAADPATGDAGTPPPAGGGPTTPDGGAPNSFLTMSPSDGGPGAPSIGRPDGTGPPDAPGGSSSLIYHPGGAPTIPDHHLVDMGHTGVPSLDLSHGGSDPSSLLTSFTPAPGMHIVTPTPTASVPSSSVIGPGLPTPGLGMVPMVGVPTRLTGGGFGSESSGSRGSALTSSGSEALGRPAEAAEGLGRTVRGGPGGMAPYLGGAGMGGESREERKTWLIGDDDWDGETSAGDGTLGRPQAPNPEG
jgi:uncharacterized protein YukE